VAACGARSSDSPSLPDAAALETADAGGLDASTAPVMPLAGFGVLSGKCDEIDDEITDPQPSLFQSEIHFDRAFASDADGALLTGGGQVMLAEGNAGGSSLLSEVFAFELLARCELAALLKTELEIDYDDEATKITDLMVDIDGERLGVSVTRAVGYPFDDPYTALQARELLDKKLGDIQLSTAHVADADRWQKQILVVLAYGPPHADAIAQALAEVAPEVRGDTVVWVLVTGGADLFIYCDGPCTG
jgi:hypothetical protein